MTSKFYSEWTQAQILALVLQGIRRGKIPDQTILNNGDPDSPRGESAALSAIIQNAIKLPPDKPTSTSTPN